MNIYNTQRPPFRPDIASRRRFLATGGLAFGGMTLVDLLRREAAALEASGGDALADKALGDKRSVIVVFQAGGPSHLETWDLKPKAPVEYRGEFTGIDTSIPGYQVGEYMPRLAKLCHKL